MFDPLHLEAIIAICRTAKSPAQAWQLAEGAGKRGPAQPSAADKGKRWRRKLSFKSYKVPTVGTFRLFKAAIQSPA